MCAGRGTCGLLDGQAGGGETVLGVEGKEVHVVPNAELLVERPAVAESLATRVVHAREVTASWRTPHGYHGGHTREWLLAKGRKPHEIIEVKSWRRIGD